VHVKRTLRRDVLQVGQIKSNQRGCERLKEGEKDWKVSMEDTRQGSQKEAATRVPAEYLKLNSLEKE
jgi:hypothetical protein